MTKARNDHQSFKSADLYAMARDYTGRAGYEGQARYFQYVAAEAAAKERANTVAA